MMDTIDVRSLKYFKLYMWHLMKILQDCKIKFYKIQSK